MRTIAVVNQKGGCGKTTVSINLASALAQTGHKVLLVDMDSQSHCAVGLAVPEEQIEQSIYDVLISKSRNEPIRLSEILWQISDRLELAPSSIDLSAFEQQMAGVPERESCLKNVLDEVAETYDYTVIDCPPAVGLLTFNALRAATDVVVPVETGYFALHGLSKQLETLGILCKRCKQQVNVKVLASMYDIRTKMAREILAELRNHFSDRMFKTVINFNTKIKEAASFGQPINEYDPASKGQQDFQVLAQELIGIEALQESRQLVNSLAEQLEAISTSATELLQRTKVDRAPELKTQTKAPQEILDVMTVRPAPVETAPQPMVTEQPRPVLLEQPMPVVMEQAKPIVLEQPRPVVMEQPKPIVLEQPMPIVQEQPMPVVMEQPKPVLLEQPKPVVLPRPETKALDVEAKLSQYYGVTQTSEAILFVSLYPRAKAVQIAGDFNNWRPENTPMQPIGESGMWQVKVPLAQGRYRYRLVVDGQWQQDPYNEKTELNPFGEYNSVLEVK